MHKSKIESAEILGLVTDLSKCMDLRGMFFSNKTCHLQKALTSDYNLPLQGVVFMNCRIPNYVELDDSCLLIDCTEYEGFKNIELIGLKYNAQEFEDLDLSDAVVESSRFESCILKKIDFRRALLKNTVFYYTTIRDSDFRDMKFDACVFISVNLKGVDFSGHSFEGLTIEDVGLLSACNFSRTIVRNAKSFFRDGATIKEMDFSYADVSNVGSLLSNRPMSECRFDNADLSNNKISMLTVSYSNFAKSKIVSCGIRSSRFLECTFECVDFSGTEMSYIKFNSSSLNGSTLSSTRLENSHMVESSLSEATFYYTLIVDSKFDMTGFRSTKLEICVIKDCLFRDCSFESADLSVVHFINCKFIYCKFEGASFKDVIMESSEYDDKTTGLPLELMQTMSKI